MLMLDLCAGLGGASQAMRDRGWHVVTVDTEPSFRPDILADIREWNWSGPRPDLVWASPPCTEFAREFMPWSRTGRMPDMSVVLACKRVIDRAAPRYWILENVKGAARHFASYFGPPAAIFGAFWLWGYFPAVNPRLTYRKKESYSSRRAAERAMIPYALSLALALAIEQQQVLEIQPCSS